MQKDGGLRKMEITVVKTFVQKREEDVRVEEGGDKLITSCADFIRK